jgi:allantoate deiminase
LVVKQISAFAADPAAFHAMTARLAAEVMARCDAVAMCSDEPGRITRLFCSAGMRDVHRLVGEYMKSAGMAVRVDAAGNLVGTYLPPGCDSRRRIIIGSHLDSVANAGRYDGVLGVMMGIALVDALREANAALPWAIDVIGFSEEEGVRFKTPFIGSRALVGTLDEATLNIIDACGVSMREALLDFNADSAAVADCRVDRSSVVAYIEPHIEQGPLLELVAEPVGVVTAIAGQTRLTVEWVGRGGHAGTAPMVQRRDPLVAACKWVTAVAELGQQTAGLVATVGRLEVDPNIPNCIPGKVRTSLDVRHHDDAVRTGAVNELSSLARRLGEQNGPQVSIHQDHEHAAVAMDAASTERLAGVIASLGHEPQRLVSGAGHDAGVMAAVAPAAMLFLRCAGGVSHHPDESVTEGDVRVGLSVLLKFIEELADADGEI